jgi:hypothetical protein
MRVADVIVVALLGAALAGCGFDQIAAQQRTANLKQQFDAAMNDCRARFPTDDPKTVVAKMQCVNQAYAIELPALGSNVDLAQNFMTYRMSVAEQYQNGQITHAQAATMLADKWSQLISEAQRRNAINQTAAAQQRAADATQAAADWEAFGNAVTAANAAFAAPQQPQTVRLQTTCNHLGNMTTCN